MIDILYDLMNSDKYIVRNCAYEITKFLVYKIDNKELIKQRERIKNAEINRATKRLIDLQKLDLHNSLNELDAKIDISENCPFPGLPNQYCVSIDDIKEHLTTELENGKSYFELKDQIKQFKRKVDGYPRVFNQS